MQKQQLRTRKGDIKNYNIEAEIGHGASGVCYKASSKIDGSVCAIKKISINTIKGNSLKFALKQVQLLKQLKHPNIIKYYDSFVDDGYLYIVMEYASKGDMHAMLKRRKIKQQFYTQVEIWDMARQLLQALRYLHQKSIVHRDFKTLNIFIGEKNNLHVGDLGVSKIIKNDMSLYSRVGTPLYLPPEIIKYEKYDYKADIWGFGCVMYVIAALSHPFQGKNIISLGQNILHSEIKHIPNYSDQFNTFIKLALQKNPSKRATAKSLLLSYFSPEQQKQRIQKGNQKSTKNIQNFKIQTKDRLSKYSSLIDESQFKKSQKIIPKISAQIELKERNSISKNNNKNVAQKIVNLDQTIILQPSCSKIDQPHQKTRTRVIYNSCKSKIANCIIQDNYISNNQRNIFHKDVLQNQKICAENQSLVFYRPQREQKIQTQAPQTNHPHRYRHIQSAKSRNYILPSTMSLNNKKSEKQFIVSSVNRIFFQSEIEKTQKEEKKILHRPKSSLGRKTLVSANQIKFIKKIKDSQQHSLLQTRTQLLRKPEMIII